MILVTIANHTGDCQIPGFTATTGEKKGYFTAESFSFGVQRELTDSAKSGTADVTLGVGELQECTVSKSMDAVSTFLARKAISGSSVGTVEIKFVEAVTVNEEMGNVVFLQFKLDNTFIKSWTMSGDADGRPTEDVALWYNKIAFTYFATTDGKIFTKQQECCWDHVQSKPWADPGLPSAVESYNSTGEKLIK